MGPSLRTLRRPDCGTGQDRHSGRQFKPRHGGADCRSAGVHLGRRDRSRPIWCVRRVLPAYLDLPGALRPGDGAFLALLLQGASIGRRIASRPCRQTQRGLCHRAGGIVSPREADHAALGGWFTDCRRSDHSRVELTSPSAGSRGDGPKAGPSSATFRILACRGPVRMLTFLLSVLVKANGKANGANMYIRQLDHADQIAGRARCLRRKECPTSMFDPIAPS